MTNDNLVKITRYIKGASRTEFFKPEDVSIGFFCHKCATDLNLTDKQIALLQPAITAIHNDELPVMLLIHQSCGDTADMYNRIKPGCRPVAIENSET